MRACDLREHDVDLFFITILRKCQFSPPATGAMLCDMDNDPDDGMIRISHAPQYRDVHLATVFRWARLGKLPTVKLATGRTFISLDDVDALLAPVAA